MYSCKCHMKVVWIAYEQVLWNIPYESRWISISTHHPLMTKLWNCASFLHTYTSIIYPGPLRCSSKVKFSIMCSNFDRVKNTQQQCLPCKMSINGRHVTNVSLYFHTSLLFCSSEECLIMLVQFIDMKRRRANYHVICTQCEIHVSMFTQYYNSMITQNFLNRCIQTAKDLNCFFSRYTLHSVDQYDFIM